MRWEFDRVSGQFFIVRTKWFIICSGFRRFAFEDRLGLGAAFRGGILLGHAEGGK